MEKSYQNELVAKLARELSELRHQRDSWKTRLTRVVQQSEAKNVEIERLRTMAEVTCVALGREVQRRQDAEVLSESYAARLARMPPPLPSIQPAPRTLRRSPTSPTRQSGLLGVGGASDDPGQQMLPDPVHRPQRRSVTPDMSDEDVIPPSPKRLRKESPEAKTTADSPAPSNRSRIRNARECPVCNKTIVKLAQHLRRQHGIDAVKARGISKLVERGPPTKRQRKESPKAKTTADSPAPSNRSHFRNARECPVCNKTILKLAQHLRRQHGIDAVKARGISKVVGRGPRTDSTKRLRHHCTVIGCSSFVADLPFHMRMQHRTRTAPPSPSP